MKYAFSNKIVNLKPSAIREILKAPSTPETISFAAGNPAPESFPVNDLAELSAEIYRDMPNVALQYGVTDGYTPLREEISKRQRAKFNIGRLTANGDAFDDMTIVVTGGQQGIELACKVFCNEGDVVICEDPTFIGALNAFRSNGAIPIGMPMQDDGPNVDALEKLIDDNPRTKLIYVIPTFQNPSGITTSLQKRRQLYEVAKKHGIMILEDNPYGELRFSGEEIPTIKSFDDDGLVIYCSSFSKILSAGMRVGFVVAPEEVAAKMVVSKQTSDVHTNLFFQILCHKYMTERDLDGHIKNIRSIYRHKCQLMLDSLDKFMPSEVKYTRPDGGLFIWGTLPPEIDADTYIKKALERNVRVVPGATFNCDTTSPSNSFRLNYSTPTDEQIVRGIEILGQLAHEMLV